ncbi:hypothetical protein [Streptomyces sp. NPDC005303]|uniref:hypothetical protein n=1 Tax=Streptomyces sp. NPDC005303 TaxID=3155713 RepID=UPI0033A23D16
MQSPYLEREAAATNLARSTGADAHCRARSRGRLRRRQLPPALADEVDTQNSGRGPLLLISGDKAHTVPETVTRATLKQYRHSEAVTYILSFPDRVHSLTIDSGRREVADTVLDWLRKKNPEGVR